MAINLAISKRFYIIQARGDGRFYVRRSLIKAIKFAQRHADYSRTTVTVYTIASVKDWVNIHPSSLIAR